MHIIRAETAGFCMGVGLALRKLDQLLEEYPEDTAGRMVMFGPIIHNPQVLAEYASKGVVRADTLDAVHSGDHVVIRAHGIPRQDEAQLLRLGAKVVDATCPKVKRAQLAIAEATACGTPLYLFGEAEHPEVRGLVSYTAGPCHIIGSLRELQEQFPHIVDTAQDLVLAAQTTQEREEFEAIRNWLGLRKQSTVLSTICDATRRRQEEAAQIAERVTGMIVVGGRDSGNTRRLADVVRSRGIPAWHIETPEEVSTLDALRECSIIGITAGASTPRTIIDAVQRMLERQPLT
ncbi:MAG: 4-hydroxy-3-methylbut-2-enyl diphosphate reductase [Bilophila sp.]